MLCRGGKFDLILCNQLGQCRDVLEVSDIKTNTFRDTDTKKIMPVTVHVQSYSLKRQTR